MSYEPSLEGRYQRKVEEARPALITLLLDDSGSMQDPMPGDAENVAKHQWVERYLRVIMRELLARCSVDKGDDRLVSKARYHIDIITYGNQATPWHSEPLDVPSMVANLTKRNPDFFRKNGGLLGGREGGTDTKAAFRLAFERIEATLQTSVFNESFPPMLFHLTDGASNTDAEPIADSIRHLETLDGATLIVNAFIGTSTSLVYSGPTDFPGYLSTTDVGDNEDNLRLYRMSSVLPPSLEDNLSEGIFPAIRPRSRLFFDVRTTDMFTKVMQVVGSGGSRSRR